MADTNVKLSNKNVLTLLKWFSVCSNELDIAERDMNLFKRIIEPNLSDDFKGMIENIYKKYENQ